MRRSIGLATLTLLTVVGAVVNPVLAQGSTDRVIAQAQHAVSERIASRENGRESAVQFNTDARTELRSNESLAIERRDRFITIASSRAAAVTFEADGREQIEESPNGRSVRTRPTLSGDRLVVSTEGDRSFDYEVTFEPVNDGRGLRVTRRVSDEGLREPVVATSVYDKTSATAQLNLRAVARGSSRGADTSRGPFPVPDGTLLVAVLSESLSTARTGQGDPVTLAVRSPSQFEGALIDGHVARVASSGRVSGRAEMAFEFDRIRARNGRAYDFTGYIESIATANGDTVRVDREGQVSDESQTSRTATRTGIGAAVGAVIGAVTGGGRGAAIGAAVGAGVGAGSVFVQGRDDLELPSGTEFRIRAGATTYEGDPRSLEKETR